jgi:hypothetical protein
MFAEGALSCAVLGSAIGVADAPGAVEADALAVGDAVPVADGSLLGDGDALGALEAEGVQPVSRQSSAAIRNDRGVWNMYPVCEAFCVTASALWLSRRTTALAVRAHPLLLLGLRLRRVRRSGRPALLDPLPIGQRVLHRLELRELGAPVLLDVLSELRIGRLLTSPCAVAHRGVDDLRDSLELAEWHREKCTKPG